MVLGDRTNDYANLAWQQMIGRTSPARLFGRLRLPVLIQGRLADVHGLGGDGVPAEVVKERGLLRLPVLIQGRLVDVHCLGGDGVPAEMVEATLSAG